MLSKEYLRRIFFPNHESKAAGVSSDNMQKSGAPININYMLHETNSLLYTLIQTRLRRSGNHVPHLHTKQSTEWAEHVYNGSG